MDFSIFESSSIFETKGATCSWANFLTVGEKKKLISLYLINLACINLKKKKGGLKINDKNPIHKLRRTPPRVLSQAMWSQVHSPALLIIISSSVNVCRGARGSPLLAALSWASDWEQFRAWGGVFQEDRQLGKFLRSCENSRHWVGNTRTRARAREGRKARGQKRGGNVSCFGSYLYKPTLCNFFQQNKRDWPGALRFTILWPKTQAGLSGKELF